MLLFNVFSDFYPFGHWSKVVQKSCSWSLCVPLFFLQASRKIVGCECQQSSLHIHILNRKVRHVCSCSSPAGVAVSLRISRRSARPAPRDPPPGGMASFDGRPGRSTSLAGKMPPGWHESGGTGFLAPPACHRQNPEPSKKGFYTQTRPVWDCQDGLPISWGGFGGSIDQHISQSH